MRYVTGAAFLCLAVSAAAQQSHVGISMPPNARHAGKFQLTNQCPSDQKFDVATSPKANWLHADPSTLDVAGGTLFEIHVTVDTSAEPKFGAYHSGIVVSCLTCAASDPPCLDIAREIPITMTVADIKKPGEFEAIAAPSSPAPPDMPTLQAPPVPDSSSESVAAHVETPLRPAPRPASVSRLFLVAAGAGFLLCAAGLLYATRRKKTLKPVAPGVDVQGPAETERHHIRR